MRRRMAALLVLLALVAAGCGGDNEAAKESGEDLDAPPLTVPGGDASELQDTTETGTGTGTDTAPTTTPAEPGAETAPAQPDPAAPDGPENDTAPEPGTPPAEFEEFCAENPGACE